jgi:DNA replication initiation complex subunit (GINS family)
MSIILFEISKIFLDGYINSQVLYLLLGNSLENLTNVEETVYKHCTNLIEEKRSVILWILHQEPTP